MKISAVALVVAEYGYTGPQLGILADGDWFFVSGGAP